MPAESRIASNVLGLRVLPAWTGITTRPGRDECAGSPTERLVSRNVARLVDRPRIERKPINPLTPDEARRFLTAIRGHRLEALYSVALALGLRQGEALGLRWDDVHFP